MTTKLQNGYTARAATMDDLETAVDLMNTFSRHYLGEDEAPLEAIRNEWQSPGFNPEKNIQLVFTPEGQAVGYVEAWDTANYVATKTIASIIALATIFVYPAICFCTICKTRTR